jgi:cytochrome c-type biogenesis protein CcmH
LAAKIPADASLFVFVRSPTGGAPLAVKRRPARLPQDVDLSAADAMVAGHGVQPGQKVLVVARISSSGSPLPRSGDLSGEISCVAGKGGAQSLQIDKLDQQRTDKN